MSATTHAVSFFRGVQWLIGITLAPRAEGGDGVHPTAIRHANAIADWAYKEIS